MHIDWQISPMKEWRADVVLFYAFEDSTETFGGLGRWLTEHPGWAGLLDPPRDFVGKLLQTAIYYGSACEPVARVMLVGLGAAASFDLEKLRNATAAALRKCRELKIARVGLPLPALDGMPTGVAAALREAVIGGTTGLYLYQALTTRKQQPEDFPAALEILAATDPDAGLREAVLDAVRITSGIVLSRDLVTAPANLATPAYLAKTAAELADTYGFTLTVIDLEQAREMGMGLFVAVAQGSREPACLIVVEHCPAGTEQDAPLVFVGKGITFDTGGISIKPSAKMEFMKHDMAGAAAVLGAFKSIGESGLRKRIVGILPCCENMPDGKAYKPGDVLRSLAGLTVEVISTDAEGRLILADALSYALRYKPAAIVDIATLTGACIIALGDRVAAVMGNREEFIDAIRTVGSGVGECLWPLPQWELYCDDLKSEIADFKNVGERKGGAVLGGIFLKQFVPDEVTWAHLDIAGPAWTEKDLMSIPKGATGFGVRTLLELARQWR